MLRTLGANRRQILTSVVVEAFVIGLVASIVGVLAGIGFAPAISALFKARRHRPARLGHGDRDPHDRRRPACSAPGSRCSPRCCRPCARPGSPPVQRAARGRRARRPRASAASARSPASSSPRLGVALMVLGLFDAIQPAVTWVGVGAAADVASASPCSARSSSRRSPRWSARPLERLRGVPGRLARENAVRNPGRTASTAAALMIGLALVSFVDRLRGRPQGLDRRRDRQDDHRRPDPLQRRRLLRHPGRNGRRGPGGRRRRGRLAPALHAGHRRGRSGQGLPHPDRPDDRGRRSCRSTGRRAPRSCSPGSGRRTP